MAATLVASLVALALQQETTAETEHYRLFVQDGAATAAEYGEVLEHAWREFEQFFGTAPKLAKRERLEIRLYRDREAWADGLRGDGAYVAQKDDRLWFRPESAVVHLYRQDAPYWTRFLLLAGACQQFHHRAKAKHRDMSRLWYVRGIAEHLALHTWDGETLALGLRPRLCMLDYPAEALGLFDDAAGSSAIHEGDSTPPALSWALVSFAIEGEGGRHRRRLDKLALGKRGSKVSGLDFLRDLGKPQHVVQQLYDWLSEEQLDFELVDGYWQDLGGGRIDAPTAGLALLRPRAVRFACDLVVAPNTSGGIVCGWLDEENHVSLVVAENWLLVSRQTGGETELDRRRVPIRSGEIWRLRAELDVDVEPRRVHLHAGHINLGSHTVSGSAFGLVVSRGGTRFSDLEWE